MSLNVQPWYFADQQESPYTLAGTGIGIAFTSGTSNADGSAVSVLSALGFDACYLVVIIGNTNASASDANCLLDILIDPAGGTSWSAFIDDLCCGMIGAQSGLIPLAGQFHFPLWIPAGASLGVQARSAGSSPLNGRVAVYAYGNPSRPEMWWCGQKVESLGINAASSKGTNITANNGSFGSWTSVGSTTSARYGAIQLGVNGTDNSALAVGYNWEIGYGSNKLPGSPLFHSSFTTAESGTRNGFHHPVWCDIPAGTQMQVRGIGSTVTETVNLALYGVY